MIDIKINQIHIDINEYMSQVKGSILGNVAPCTAIWSKLNFIDYITLHQKYSKFEKNRMNRAPCLAIIRYLVNQAENCYFKRLLFFCGI